MVFKITRTNNKVNVRINTELSVADDVVIFSGTFEHDFVAELVREKLDSQLAKMVKNAYDLGWQDKLHHKSKKENPQWFI